MSDESFIRRVPGFEQLSEAEAHKLLDSTHVETFQPGERIIEHGAVGDALYVIQEGNVSVLLPAEDGGMAEAATLGPGQVVGEMALLTKEPRVADVVVGDGGPCRCIVMPREKTEALLRRHPFLARFLTKLLLARMTQSRSLRRIGHYEIGGILGSGGMATVFEAQHEILQQPVAVKMLSHHLVYRTGFTERFRAEARTIAQLDHPGIVCVFDAYAGFGTHFIVMERVQGADLGAILRDRGPFRPDDARLVLVQMARALGHAHENGVIHRDVKPSNALMEPTGRVRVVDFGIADGVARGDQVDTHILCSPDYVAPEVVRGEAPDARTDIYSLGILAYKLLTGRVPFPVKDPSEKFVQHRDTPMPDVREHCPDLPDDLHRFIDQATRKDPAERQVDCDAVIRLLLDGIGGAAGEERQRTTITFEHGASEAPATRFLVKTVGQMADRIPGLSMSVEPEESPDDDSGP